MECWRDFRLLGRRAEKSIVLLIFCSLSTLTGFLNVCFDVGTVFLLNRFLTVWVCFDFWPHLSNTILAYFLTSSHFLFRLLQRSINWLIENLLLYSVICYNSSSLTAINKKNIKTPLVVHVGKFCRLFLLCMCMWVCVVVVWTGVRLVSNYIFFCLFFFSIFLFF